MRLTFRTALGAVALICAIGAITASSALASPEWYVKKAGVYSKVTEPVKVSLENTFEISDTEYDGRGLPLAVSCTAKSEGELKSGGATTLRGFSVTAGTGCKPAKVKESEINACTKFRAASLANSLFSLSLYKEGTEVRGLFGEEPVFSFECEPTGFGPGHDVCDMNTSVHTINNATSGLVEATFDSKSVKTYCSAEPRGSKAGEWKGVFKIKATTAGVEAIKVE